MDAFRRIFKPDEYRDEQSEAKDETQPSHLCDQAKPHRGDAPHRWPGAALVE
jgi:hypothetical protein